MRSSSRPLSSPPSLRFPRSSRTLNQGRAHTSDKTFQVCTVYGYGHKEKQGNLPEIRYSFRSGVVVCFPPSGVETLAYCSVTRSVTRVSSCYCVSSEKTRVDLLCVSPPPLLLYVDMHVSWRRGTRSGLGWPWRWNLPPDLSRAYLPVFEGSASGASHSLFSLPRHFPTKNIRGLILYSVSYSGQVYPFEYQRTWPRVKNTNT